eukprot:2389943-Rhodomonas_salina.1
MSEREREKRQAVLCRAGMSSLTPSHSGVGLAFSLKFSRSSVRSQTRSESVYAHLSHIAQPDILLISNHHETAPPTHVTFAASSQVAYSSGTLVTKQQRVGNIAATRWLYSSGSLVPVSAAAGLLRVVVQLDVVPARTAVSTPHTGYAFNNTSLHAGPHNLCASHARRVADSLSAIDRKKYRTWIARKDVALPAVREGGRSACLDVLLGQRTAGDGGAGEARQGGGEKEGARE